MTTIHLDNDSRRIELFQVITLKAHIKMLKAGMRNSRRSNKSLMDQAKQLTGAAFGIRDYDAAVAALEARKSALQIYIDNEVGG